MMKSVWVYLSEKKTIVEDNKPIRKPVRPCLEKNTNWDRTENLCIKDDNLEVLKLLQEISLGKVKMIYINPLYNAGNDFIYRDDFKRSAADYDKDNGVYDEDCNYSPNLHLSAKSYLLCNAWTMVTKHLCADTLYS